MSKYHRTAIARRAPSAPARLLHGRGLLTGRTLDYGAGRGVDAAAFGLEAFEPNGGPAMPAGLFDTIMCNFVLNVVDKATEAAILADIRERLAPGGRAYLTVRRDLDSDDPAGYTTGSGTFQRHVALNLPVLVSKPGAFVTYILTQQESN